MDKYMTKRVDIAFERDGIPFDTYEADKLGVKENDGKTHTDPDVPFLPKDGDGQVLQEGDIDLTNLGSIDNPGIANTGVKEAQEAEVDQDDVLDILKSDDGNNLATESPDGEVPDISDGLDGVDLDV